jgi:large subunit ribosomal protein L15
LSTGKRIVDLHTSLAILNRNDGTFSHPPDSYQRTPFQHPGVDLLPRLTEKIKLSMTDRKRMADFAVQIGLLTVLRWKPRIVSKQWPSCIRANPWKADNLHASGVETAVSQALYAIVGAIALQRGGEVASRIVKDRILGQMGFKETE